MKTEILKFNFSIDNKWRITRNRFYYSTFLDWWDKFKIGRKGLIVGERKGGEIEIKKVFLEKYPKIEEIHFCDIKDSEIIWDITTPYNNEKVLPPFDWIICQATLEHVVDPTCAIKNMAFVLKERGFIYLHSHGPTFPEHRGRMEQYSLLDIFRFLPDFIKVVIPKVSRLELRDYVWSRSHWIAVYEKLVKIE